MQLFNTKHRPTMMKLCYLCLFVVTYVLINFIETTYKEKSWYDPRFWPPAHYIKGYASICMFRPIMRDQGNSI